MKITKDISIEELVEILPAAVKYLMVEGIKCIACGEPIWGTLEDAAKEKGHNQESIARFVLELNNLFENKKDDQTPEGQITFDKIDL
jgi:methionine synthase II (cobalamin-independent)